MAKDLITRENTDVALSKSKSFMGIIKNIFNNKIVQDDDSWMQRLWDWADENDVPVLKFLDKDHLKTLDYYQEELEEQWEGLARTKGSLLKQVELDLSYVDYAVIPKEIYKIESLKKLVLSDTNINSISDDIGKLTKLQELWLDGNNIKELPAELGDLINLRILDISENKLKKLPATIGKLSKLEVLILNDNLIDELPTEISSLNNLWKLELKNNKLEKLPDEIINLTNISELYLGFNPLILTLKQKEWLNTIDVVFVDDDALDIEIDNAILADTQIANIDEDWMQRLWDWADENYITDLEWVDDDALDEGGYKIGLARDKETLLNLETLNLQYNELSNIPREIGKIINLSELYLSSNRLEYVPKEIGNLTNLTILMISSNQLEKLPKEIGKLNKLSKLVLPDNQLINVPIEIGNLSNLTALRLDKNKLHELPKEVENLKSLTMLDLSDNRFNKFPEALFQLVNLKNLYCYGNDICEIPKEIGNLLNLTALGMGENQITILPKQIGYLTNLTMLSLAENNLVVLPKEICNLIELTHLNFEKNKLKELPEGICNLRNLEFLLLKDNPLFLTDKQKNWINRLIDDGCEVSLDDDARERDIHTKEDTKNKKSSLSSYFNHSVSGNTVDSEIVEDDDSWMQRLWDWADQNDILDLEWIDENEYGKRGFWQGLPRESTKLLATTKLILDENKFAILSKEISHLVGLTELSLVGCQITELPKEINNLNNLKVFLLAKNNISELTNEIKNLENLDILDLRDNKLEELPVEICELKNLTILTLGNNELKNLPSDIINLSILKTLDLSRNHLSLTYKQILWLKKLEEDGCDLYLDDDVLEKVRSIENLDNTEEENTFTFDNGRFVTGIPGRKSIIIESLHAIIHNFSDKKLCIQKQFNKIKNEETDIYYSIIGQKHLDYSGSKFNVQDAKNIYEKAGSIGVCESRIKVKYNSYIEWRFDFYQNDIYLESVLVKNKTRTKLYSRTLKNGPSELLSVYEIYIENGYKEALKIMETIESSQVKIHNEENSKYSNEMILGTSYNMIKEVFDESDGNKPISNRAPFLPWDKTIRLLKEDNGKSFIQLDDGTGYGMAFDADKIVFIVKEIDGTPAFVNKQFYEKFYQEIYKNKNV